MSTEPVVLYGMSLDEKRGGFHKYSEHKTIDQAHDQMRYAEDYILLATYAQMLKLRALIYSKQYESYDFLFQIGERPTHQWKDGVVGYNWILAPVPLDADPEDITWFEHTEVSATLRCWRLRKSAYLWEKDNRTEMPPPLPQSTTEKYLEAHGPNEENIAYLRSVLGALVAGEELPIDPAREDRHIQSVAAAIDTVMAGEQIKSPYRDVYLARVTEGLTQKEIGSRHGVGGARVGQMLQRVGRIERYQALRTSTHWEYLLFYKTLP